MAQCSQTHTHIQKQQRLTIYRNISTLKHSKDGPADCMYPGEGLNKSIKDRVAAT